MHPSALEATRRLIDAHVPKDTSLAILDVGSQQTANQTLSHRELFDLELCRYVGVDVEPGRNVDLVLEKPYGLPFEDNSFDVVICGQVFEHIPYFWVTAMEFARVTKPDGFIILSTPSRGHVHFRPFDGWRFYSQGFEAIASFCDLRCIEASTDHPPVNPESGRLDYSGISSEGHSDQYWGDTVGIFQKTQFYRSDQMAKLRKPLIAWANQRAAEEIEGRTATQRRGNGLSALRMKGRRTPRTIARGLKRRLKNAAKRLPMR